jgi:hypothetical protein
MERRYIAPRSRGMHSNDDRYLDDAGYANRAFYTSFQGLGGTPDHSRRCHY